jgi:hypothetical protein
MAMKHNNLIILKTNMQSNNYLPKRSACSDGGFRKGRAIFSVFIRTVFLKLFVFVLLAGFAMPVTAQETTHPNKWSLETSLSFPPAAQIYMLKASLSISERSELGFGPAFQNWKNADKVPRGQANAYTLLLSYRYFFYKSFHMELELWPAHNHFNSLVDGKTYKGFELWVEYKVGYKAAITKNLYLNFQPGLAHGVWMQNRWPEFKEDSAREFIKRSIIFVPQILVGWTF